MITKHFFKTLILFAGMIILGLTGVVLVSYIDKNGESSVPNDATIAK